MTKPNIGENANHLWLPGSALSCTAPKSIPGYDEKHGHGGFPDQLKGAKRPHKTGQEYQLWEEGFHPQLIVDHAMYIQKAEYIHYNPVRRGYVEQPEHWRYSSYRQYPGGDSLIPVKPLV